MDEQTKLSDNGRRFVCRIVFLVLCALPTGIVGYSLFHQPTAGQWEYLIRAQLGIPIQIASVETPVPFTTILRGVRIPKSLVSCDGEPREELLIDEIRIDMGDTTNTVTVVQPLKIPLQSLSQVVQRFMDHMGQLDLDHKLWRFEFAKIVLTDQNLVASEFDLKPVAMNVIRGDAGQSHQVIGSLFTRIATANSMSTDEYAVLELKFFDNGIELDTGDGVLPVRLLRYWYPDLQWLGSQCQFQGRLTINDMRGGSGCVQGELYAVELDRISSPYSLGIVGQCDVGVIRCDFSANQIEYANLQVNSSQPINLPGSLLTAARRLGIQTGELQAHGIYTFPGLDLRVAIDEGRLLFSGSDGSVISRNSEGDPLISVHPADVSVHDLAAIMTGKTLGDDAIAFLKRFRLSQRLARDEANSESRF